MFYRRIVRARPQVDTTLSPWLAARLCQGLRPLSGMPFLPRILAATTTLRRGAGQTAVSPPASLGHAGTCWDMLVGLLPRAPLYALGGSLGLSWSLPGLDRKTRRNIACRQLWRDARWGASALAFGRGTSVQQPPPLPRPHADSRAPASRGNWRLTPNRPRAACNLGNGH
jgi:hypothetical protein